MTFDNIADQCSCPVELIDSNESIGWYYHRQIHGSKCRIEIETTGDKTKDITSLLHEQAHSKHDDKGCKCMDGRFNKTLAEYHAYKDGLQTALKLGDKNVIRCTIDMIKSQARLDYPDPHRTAAKKVMRLKLWQKAIIV